MQHPRPFNVSSFQPLHLLQLHMCPLIQNVDQQDSLEVPLVMPCSQLAMLLHKLFSTCNVFYPLSSTSPSRSRSWAILSRTPVSLCSFSHLCPSPILRLSQLAKPLKYTTIMTFIPLSSNVLPIGLHLPQEYELFERRKSLIQLSYHSTGQHLNKCWLNQ